MQGRQFEKLRALTEAPNVPDVEVIMNSSDRTILELGANTFTLNRSEELKLVNRFTIALMRKVGDATHLIMSNGSQSVKQPGDVVGLVCSFKNAKDDIAKARARLHMMREVLTVPGDNELMPSVLASIVFLSVTFENGGKLGHPLMWQPLTDSEEDLVVRGWQLDRTETWEPLDTTRRAHMTPSAFVLLVLTCIFSRAWLTIPFMAKTNATQKSIWITKDLPIEWNTIVKIFGKSQLSNQFAPKAFVLTDTPQHIFFIAADYLAAYDFYWIDEKKALLFQNGLLAYAAQSNINRSLTISANEASVQSYRDVVVNSIMHSVEKSHLYIRGPNFAQTLYEKLRSAVDTLLDILTFADSSADGKNQFGKTGLSLDKLLHCTKTFKTFLDGWPSTEKIATAKTVASAETSVAVLERLNMQVREHVPREVLDLFNDLKFKFVFNETDYVVETSQEMDKNNLMLTDLQFVDPQSEQDSFKHLGFLPSNAENVNIQSYFTEIASGRKVQLRTGSFPLSEDSNPLVVLARRYARIPKILRRMNVWPFAGEDELTFKQFTATSDDPEFAQIVIQIKSERYITQTHALTANSQFRRTTGEEFISEGTSRWTSTSDVNRWMYFALSTFAFALGLDFYAVVMFVTDSTWEKPMAPLLNWTSFIYRLASKERIESDRAFFDTNVNQLSLLIQNVFNRSQHMTSHDAMFMSQVFGLLKSFAVMARSEGQVTNVSLRINHVFQKLHTVWSQFGLPSALPQVELTVAAPSNVGLGAGRSFVNPQLLQPANSHREFQAIQVTENLSESRPVEVVAKVPSWQVATLLVEPQIRNQIERNFMNKYMAEVTNQPFFRQYQSVQDVSGFVPDILTFAKDQLRHDIIAQYNGDRMIVNDQERQQRIDAGYRKLCRETFEKGEFWIVPDKQFAYGQRYYKVFPEDVILMQETISQELVSNFTTILANRERKLKQALATHRVYTIADHYKQLAELRYAAIDTLEELEAENKRVVQLPTVIRSTRIRAEDEPLAGIEEQLTYELTAKEQREATNHYAIVQNGVYLRLKHELEKSAAEAVIKMRAEISPIDSLKAAIKSFKGQLSSAQFTINVQKLGRVAIDKQIGQLTLVRDDICRQLIATQQTGTDRLLVSLTHDEYKQLMESVPFYITESWQREYAASLGEMEEYYDVKQPSIEKPVKRRIEQSTAITKQKKRHISTELVEEEDLSSGLDINPEEFEQDEPASPPPMIVPSASSSAVVRLVTQAQAKLPATVERYAESISEKLDEIQNETLADQRELERRVARQPRINTINEYQKLEYQVGQVIGEFIPGTYYCSLITNWRSVKQEYSDAEKWPTFSGFEAVVVRKLLLRSIIKVLETSNSPKQAKQEAFDTMHACCIELSSLCDRNYVKLSENIHALTECDERMVDGKITAVDNSPLPLSGVTKLRIEVLQILANALLMHVNYFQLERVSTLAQELLADASALIKGEIYIDSSATIKSAAHLLGNASHTGLPQIVSNLFIEEDLAAQLISNPQVHDSEYKAIVYKFNLDEHLSREVINNALFKQALVAFYQGLVRQTPDTIYWAGVLVKYLDSIGPMNRTASIGASENTSASWVVFVILDYLHKLRTRNAGLIEIAWLHYIRGSAELLPALIVMQLMLSSDLRYPDYNLRGSGSYGEGQGFLARPLHVRGTGPGGPEYVFEMKMPDTIKVSRYNQDNKDNKTVATLYAAGGENAIVLARFNEIDSEAMETEISTISSL
jgi:hypothetical protein